MRSSKSRAMREHVWKQIQPLFNVFSFYSWVLCELSRAHISAIIYEPLTPLLGYYHTKYTPTVQTGGNYLGLCEAVNPHSLKRYSKYGRWNVYMKHKDYTIRHKRVLQRYQGTVMLSDNNRMVFRHISLERHLKNVMVQSYLSNNIFIFLVTPNSAGSHVLQPVRICRSAVVSD